MPLDPPNSSLLVRLAKGARGPAVTLLIGVAVLALHFFVALVPSPGTFLLLGVVYAAWWSGLVSALISEGIVLATALVILTTPHPANVNSIPGRLLGIAVACTAAAIIVTFTRKRVVRALQRPLQERADLCDAIMGAMHDAILETDFRGIREVNPSFCVMTGFSRSELLGAKAPYPFWPAEQYAEIAAAMEHSTRGEKLDFQLVLNRKNGERFPVLLSVSRLPTEHAGIGRTVYSFKDISELKKVEESLRQSEAQLRADIQRRQQAEELARETQARLRAAFDNIPFEFFICDSSGRYVFQNQQSRRNWGDQIGQQPAEVGIDPAVLAAWQDNNRRAFAGEVVRNEWSYQTDSRQVIYDEIIAPILVGGESHGIMGINIDITERKHATALLETQQVELSRANAAKDRFLALMSHDLRAPLTPMLATIAGLQADGRLPAELRDDLEILRRNTEAEVQLIDDLLDLTQVHLDMVPSRLEIVDVHEILSSIRAAAGEEIAARHLTVELGFLAPLAQVPADPPRLRQALRAIFRHALQQTPDGQKIVLRTANSTPGELTVACMDAGPVLDPACLPLLFTPFPDGSSGQQARLQGLGFGLSIARTLIESHGGSLAAALNAEQQGLTLTLTLPLAVGISAAPPAAMTAADPAGLRICLVEDHLDTQRVLERILTACGYRVTVAATLAAARDAVDHQAFDLLIADIGLPDGTGLDLLAHMRQAPAPLRDVPAIAISGFASVADIRRSLQAGFSDHLVKPIALSALRAAIHTALHTSS